MSKITALLAKQSYQLFFAVLLLLLLIFFRNGLSIHATLYNDSFIYFSSAQEFVKGNLGASTIAHFDTERLQGVLPARLTTFPPGYPMLLAIGIASKLDAQSSALIISLACFALQLVVLRLIAQRLRLGALACGTLLLALVCNSIALDTSTAALSEAPFTLMILCGCWFLLRADDEDGQMRHYALAGLLFGAACLLRYAGAFFTIGLYTLSLWHLLNGRWRRVGGTLVAAIIATLPILILMLRNLLLVGNWRGGNVAISDQEPLLRVAQTFMDGLRIINHLLFGPEPMSHSLWPKLLLVTCLALALYWRAKQTTQRRAKRRHHKSATDLTVLLGCYLICLFYAALASPISHNERLLTPVLPLIGLLIWHMLRLRRSSKKSWVIYGCYAGAFCCYLGLHLAPLRHGFVPTPAMQQLQRLDSYYSDPQQRQDLIPAKSAAVLASDGQLLAYWLQRPIVSMPNRQFSQVPWTSKNVAHTVCQFNIRTLILRKKLADDNTYQHPSAWIAHLADATQTQHPAWLERIHDSPLIRIYQVHDDAPCQTL